MRISRKGTISHSQLYAYGVILSSTVILLRSDRNALLKMGTPRDTVYPWGKGAHKQKIEHYCLQ